LPSPATKDFGGQFSGVGRSRALHVQNKNAGHRHRQREATRVMLYDAVNRRARWPAKTVPQG